MIEFLRGLLAWWRRRRAAPPMLWELPIPENRDILWHRGGYSVRRPSGVPTFARRYYVVHDATDEVYGEYILLSVAMTRCFELSNGEARGEG